MKVDNLFKLFFKSQGPKKCCMTAARVHMKNTSIHLVFTLELISDNSKSSKKAAFCD